MAAALSSWPPGRRAHAWFRRRGRSNRRGPMRYPRGGSAPPGTRVAVRGRPTAPGVGHVLVGRSARRPAVKPRRRTLSDDYSVPRVPRDRSSRRLPGRDGRVRRRRRSDMSTDRATSTPAAEALLHGWHVGGLLEQAGRRHGDRPFLVGGGTRLTYREAECRTMAISRWMEAQGAALRTAGEAIALCRLGTTRLAGGPRRRA